MCATPIDEPGGPLPSERTAPLVTIASEHGAGGDLVAPRVADALGVPFLDRALPPDPEQQRPRGVIGSLARASTMLAGEPLERLDVAEGRVRSQLAEFLAGAATTGGVVLGHGGVVAVADAPTVLHVLLSGSRDGRVARVAERYGVTRDEAKRRVRGRDLARREYVRRAFGIDPDDRTLYHLIIDTVALGVDAAVELIVAAARVRTRTMPATERS